MLPPPPGVLQRGEQWARRKAHLLFADDRLVAMRGIVGGTSKEIEKGILWSWHLGKSDIDGPPVVAGRFDIDDWHWDDVGLTPSPNGRWLLWGAGDMENTYLQRLDPLGEQLTLCDNSCDSPVFTDDSRFLVFFYSPEIQRYALSDTGATALPPIEGVPYTSNMAVIAREDRMRIAAFSDTGAAAWWDIKGETVEHHPLPNVYPPFSKDLEVRILNDTFVRTSLEWNFEGEGLLVTVAEQGGNEFGIAAYHDLKGEAWQPAVHRYERKAWQSIGTNEYRVKNAGNLGVASARFFGSAVLSLGFDGTVVYRDVDDGKVSEKFKVLETGASFADFFGEDIVVVGKRNGQVQFSAGDDDERWRTAPFNGHGAAITGVRWTWDLDSQRMARMLSIDATGHTRIWDLSVPGASETDGEVRVTGDWKWVIDERRQFWPLQLPEPLWSPRKHPAMEKTTVAWNADAAQFVTLAVEPKAPLPVVLRLWTLRDGRLPRAPVVERRFAGPKTAEDTHWRLALATSDGEARVLVGDGDRLWMTDLRKQQPLRSIGGTGLALRHKGASSDLRWLVAGREKETFLIDTRRSKVTPLATPDAIEYVDEWSDDGRWLVLSVGAREALVDLTAARPQALITDADFLVLGRGRPPVSGSYLKDDPQLVWQTPGRFVESMKDSKTLGWDPSGRWLAIGHDAGRVWLTQPPPAFGAKALAAHLRAAMKQAPLPQPADAEARGVIERVFAFPDQGWVMAELENHLLLVWHRDISGAWAQPIVFTMQELRQDNIYDVRLRADGRMALIGNQILSLDPAHLMAYSRRLVNGD